MMTTFEAWRRNLWLWAIPVGFCVLNLLGITVYRAAFAGKVDRLERRYQSVIDQRDALREERVVIAAFLERVDVHEQDTNSLYSEYFQTEAQRFTSVILEVKKLARQAGLLPSAWSYPKKDFGAHNLHRRDISFGVEGTYDQLRNFINFLELTDHFVTLNSVTLGGSEANRRDPSLKINLVLSTIFAKQEVESSPEEPAT